MLPPGAASSGLPKLLFNSGPLELKLEIVPLGSTDPTVIALLAEDGDSPPISKYSPPLPAATITVTPEAVAASTADATRSSASPGPPKLKFITSAPSSVFGLPSGSTAYSMPSTM